MITFEPRRTQVAIVGRVADGLTREDLGPHQFRAMLRNHHREVVQKRDGYFVFTALPASPPSYDVALTGRQYQDRRLSVTVPAAPPALIDVPGEDELEVIITGITGGRVSFAKIPYVPPVADGATVFGQGGLTTTLAEAIEGREVDGAELTSVAGLAQGQALRIVRSSRLLLRPGPYYAFPDSTTIAGIHIVENMLGHAPIPDAQVRITAVNAVAPASVVIAGVTLFRADLPTGGTPPTVRFMIGTDAARTAFSNARGEAVFYYAPATPVTSLTVSVSKTGYVTQTLTVPVQPGERTSGLVQLVRS